MELNTMQMVGREKWKLDYIQQIVSISGAISVTRDNFFKKFLKIFYLIKIKFKCS